MPPELRRISQDDYPLWTQNLDLTYGFDYNAEEDLLKPVLELDRTFGHFADGRVVSTLSAFSLDLSVPGRTVDCGGTTVVSVAPTHRRQGLLTEMMGAHLDEVRERGEPIAALWASESEIYGRFGYGRATDAAKITITRPSPRFSELVDDPVPVRVVDRNEAEERLPAFHDSFRLTQPGMFHRNEAWWANRIFADLPSRRSGYTANRYAVVESGDEIFGYTRYRVKGDQADGHSAGEVYILELFSNRPEGWSGLWKFVLGQDLMGTYTAPLRSPHDPVFDLLEGPRRAKAVVNDGIWIRIVDLEKALTGRSYQCEFRGVVEVTDRDGYCSGTYRLDLSPQGAEVSRSSETADITLDIRDLSGIYLGRPGLVRMSRVGRVHGDPAQLRNADAAFGWDVQPWCPEIF